MESFDYIIVGSGAAGAVIASRLTEDENVKVLLLEAGGPDRHPLQNMPMAFPKVIASSNYNWRFESEPERALNGRKVPTPRGRTLGGSTAINAGLRSAAIHVTTISGARPVLKDGAMPMSFPISGGLRAIGAEQRNSTVVMDRFESHEWRHRRYCSNHWSRRRALYRYR
jgi:hypothetical protein